MATKACTPFILWMLLVIAPGCVTVQDTLMLRNIDVEGSLAQPPVHVTTPARANPTLYVSPFLSAGSGTVSTSLEHPYDGPIADSISGFDEEGLHWNVPTFTYGVHLDANLTRSLALSGGAAASVGDDRQYSAFHGAIGLFTASENLGIRFDFGLRYADVQYEGATVVLRSVDLEPADTLFYLDRGKRMQPNVYGNLTLNSTRANWPVNWFVQLGVNPQTLTSFLPRENVSHPPGYYVVDDRRAESSVLWLSLTPGVYLTLPDDHRLLLGIRILREMQAEVSSPGVLLLPMVSFDWKI